jgi:hypothetical protein
MQSPGAALGQLSASCEPTNLPVTLHRAPCQGESVQPYLAMGSLYWSQRLSPPFPFALRRWPPCPRHLLRLQPGKSWLGFSLPPAVPTTLDLHKNSTSRIPHQEFHIKNSTSPSHSVSVRTCSSGPADACRHPGSQAFSWASSVLEEPVVPRWRGCGSPLPLPIPPGPAALPPSHSRDPAARRSLCTAPLGSPRLPAASSPAGRRARAAAAPRPQGNRTEPMSARGPEREARPPRCKSHGRTRGVCPTSVRQGGQSCRAAGL